MMIDAGEELGWVQMMLGHATLEMIFRHYYRWIRKDKEYGRKFMEEIYVPHNGDAEGEKSGGSNGAMKNATRRWNVDDRCYRAIP